MEDLADSEDTKGGTFVNEFKRYTIGPFEMKGSHMFAAVYKEGGNSSLTFKSIIYQLPDSNNVPLLAFNEDNETKVKLTTFLDQNRILLQLECRYMIFNQEGTFIGDIDFGDVG